MGCGAAHRQVVSDVDQLIWRGKLFINPKNANLEKDYGFLGKMDPYLKI
jgi:hypothetical protein